MQATSLAGWYMEIGMVIPAEISKEIGHFNVFRNEEVIVQFKEKHVMPYNKRAFYEISGRVVQEAKLLLKQTDWRISGIAYCPEFEEVAHFSNFLKSKRRLRR